jgi:AraC family transcriptional regulator
MEVLNQTQKVIDMLEADIMNVDYERITKLTGIPLGLYQRIFTYICNLSLSGYVRKIKLTLSAEMLLREKKMLRKLQLNVDMKAAQLLQGLLKSIFLFRLY